jgi:hypothetical protein
MKIFFCFFPFFSFSLFAQLEYPKEIIQTLCSPSFKGRGYVAGGDSLAADYLEKQMKALGLQPIENTFFQAFSFPVNTFPGTMKLIFNQTLQIPGVDYIVDPASGGGSFSLTSRCFSLEEILNGTLSNALDSCRKNIVLPVFSLDNSTNKDTLKIIRGIAAELAQSYCPVILMQSAKFTWSVAQEQFKFPLLYVRPVLHTGDKLEIDIQAKLISHEARNVIGVLPALNKNKRTVVFSAHYDHLGKMGNAYFPGGNDNASGVAMLLSLAQSLRGKNTNTRYVFIAFAGEEVGLLGSHYYIQHPSFPLKEIDFLLNLDIMGSGEEGITVVNGTVFKKWFDKLSKINNQKHYLPLIKIRGKAANSDHYWFSENGVKSFFIYTMGPNKNYHDIYDTYNALSFAAFDSIKKLILDFVLKVKF